MNYKKLLLSSPQIDAVRDKTLGFGCEYIYDKQHHVVIQTNDDGWIQPFGYDDCHFAHHKTEDQIKIIGHPITLWECLQITPKDRQLELVDMWVQGDIDAQSEDVYKFLCQFIEYGEK